MKRMTSLPTIVRLVCYVLVITAYVLLLASLSGCELLVGAARALGIAAPDAVSQAAHNLDSTVIGWLTGWHRDVVVATAGAAMSEGARATHRAHKRRKAKKAQAPQVTH